MKVIVTIFLLLIFELSAFATEAQEGFAVVKRDTIYGIVKINFSAGSVVVKQENVNRMFIDGIESVTFLNETRETYYTYSIDSKLEFFRAIVTGENPLIEKDNILYCLLENQPAQIQEKVLYSIFGKKKVREYAFIRNISLTEKEDLKDLFSHFNDYY